MHGHFKCWNVDFSQFIIIEEILNELLYNNAELLMHIYQKMRSINLLMYNKYPNM